MQVKFIKYTGETNSFVNADGEERVYHMAAIRFEDGTKARAKVFEKTFNSMDVERGDLVEVRGNEYVNKEGKSVLGLTVVGEYNGISDSIRSAFKAEEAERKANQEEPKFEAETI